MPITVATALTGMFAGIFIHRTGHFLELIYVGTALMTLGCGLYINFSATTSVARILGFQILTGMGIGLLFEAPLLAIQATVPQDEVATATSTFGFIRTLASALSVVIGGVIFQSSMDIKVDALSAPPTNLPESISVLLSGGAAAANVGLVKSIPDPALRLAIKNAYAWSLRNMWIFYAALSGLTILSNLFIERQHLSKLHVETKTGLKEKEKEKDHVVI